MRSILGDITVRKGRKQDWPEEVNMKYSSMGASDDATGELWTYGGHFRNAPN